MIKEFTFTVSKGDLCHKIGVKAKHLNGAVRQLYQMYNFDRIVKILSY